MPNDFKRIDPRLLSNNKLETDPSRNINMVSQTMALRRVDTPVPSPSCQRRRMISEPKLNTKFDKGNSNSFSELSCDKMVIDNQLVFRPSRSLSPPRPSARPIRTNVDQDISFSCSSSMTTNIDPTDLILHRVQRKFPRHRSLTDLYSVLQQHREEKKGDSMQTSNMGSMARLISRRGKDKLPITIAQLDSLAGEFLGLKIKPRLK